MWIDISTQYQTVRAPGGRSWLNYGPQFAAFQTLHPAVFSMNLKKEFCKFPTLCPKLHLYTSLVHFRVLIDDL